MTRRNKDLGSLIGGVSQQPAEQRFPGQCEEALNCWMSPIEGLTKRHPTEHVAKLTGSTSGSGTLHPIDQGRGNKYIMYLDHQTVRVFDEVGVEKQVRTREVPTLGATVPAVTDYLDLSVGNENELTATTDMAMPDWTWDQTLNITDTPVLQPLDTGPLGYGVPLRIGTGSAATFGSDYQWNQGAVTENQTYSFYIKNVDATEVAFGYIKNSSPFASRLTRLTLTGAVVTQGVEDPGISTAITALDDDWYFVEVENFNETVSGPMSFQVVVNYSSGTASQKIDIWGPQLHFGTTPPPYIGASKLLSALTISDTTFILNSSQTPEMDSTILTDTRVEMASFVSARDDVTMFFIKSAVSGEDYTWTFENDNTLATGTVAAASSDLDAVGLQITADINAGTGTHGVTAGAFNGTIMAISAAGNGVFKHWEATASTDGLFTAIHDTVELVADLPTIMLDGYVVEITEDAEDPLVGGMFVKFSTTDKQIGLPHDPRPGFWEESTAYGTETTIDAKTMPYKVVKNIDADGSQTGIRGEVYFVLSEVIWTDRRVGDAVTNPNPSFMDNNINTMLFHQGRLTFLSDQNMIMGETSSLASVNYFRTTTRTIVDSDPVDVSANEVEVSVLRGAAQNSGELFLFSEGAQFLVSGDPAITPSNAAIQKILDVPSLPDVNPVPAGRSILFASKTTRYSSVWDMRQIQDPDVFDAQDTTLQVPKYIDGEITHLVASRQLGLALALADDKSKLYTYKFAFSGASQVQSSWSRFDFGSSVSIQGISVIDTTLWILLDRDGSLYVEKMVMGEGLVDPDSTFLLRMDRKILSTTGVYQLFQNETTVTIPYALSDLTASVAVTPEGEEISIRSLTVNGDTTDLVMPGDRTAELPWVGESYSMEYTFSEPVIQFQNQHGFVPVFAPYHILTLSVRYADCVRFSLRTTPDCGTEYSHLFDSTVISDCDVVSGASRLARGTLKTGVYSRADRVSVKLVNDSPFPSRFTSAKWEGELPRFTTS